MLALQGTGRGFFEPLFAQHRMLCLSMGQLGGVNFNQGRCALEGAWFEIQKSTGFRHGQLSEQVNYMQACAF